MKEYGKNKSVGGRKPKADPSTHRYVFRLTDQENAKFLSLFEASGLDTKAKFIVSVLFSREIKSVKIDAAAMDYYMRLTTLYGQFRSVGVNYNQVVKILYRNFSEKKAAAYLFKLEKQTAELAYLCKQIMDLTGEFEVKYLKK
jgi:MobC-like protein